jgi:hypothetical protein
MREHPAAVLDCDLELVALKETRFSSQPLDLAANWRVRSCGKAVAGGAANGGQIMIKNVERRR